jgi:hypothetical protein
MSIPRIVRYVVGVVLLCGGAMTPSGAAAQTVPPSPAGQPGPPVTIRVKFTVERLDGQKLVDSVPIEVIARANLPSNDTTSFNHGMDVPLVQSMKDGGTGYQYRPTGNNVQIRRATADDRMITFELVFDLSSTRPDTGEAVQPVTAFRKFTIQTPVSVRPGQTLVVATSTDAMTHETTKLSVAADIVR